MARILYIAGIEGQVPSLAANSIQVMHMAAALKALGHQVTLAVPRGRGRLPATPAPPPAVFDFYGIRQRFHIARLPAPGGTRRGAGRLALFCFALAARRLAQRGGWELVYCRNALASVLFAHAGVRHTFEAHHFRLAGRVDRWHLPVLRSPLVERLVLLAAAEVDRFVAAGVERGKIVVAPDAAAPPAAPATAEMLAAARRRLEAACGDRRAGGDRTIAVCAGSLGRLKGTDLLLATAPLTPAVDYVLLGGPDRGTIERYRTLAAAIPNLHVAGVVPPAAVPALLAAADLLLLPHSRDSERRYLSPLKLFEALAAGRPLVATAVAAARELLADGDSALLVPADQPQALASAIEKLRADAVLGERLAATARGMLGAHTWEARARRILDAQPARSAPRRRVLHILNSFHPLVGGAERQAAALARRQAAAGDAVEVLTRRRRGLAPLDGLGPVLVRRLRSGPFGGAGFLATLLLALWPRRRALDVVHAHQAHTPAIAAALLRRLGGPPAVVKLAGLDVPRGHALPAVLKRRALGDLDRVVATQTALAAAVRALGIERVTVIPNGVDPERYAPAPDRAQLRARLGLAASDHLVLYVGRLERVKGIDLLVQAWPEVAASDPGARLWIAGGGSLAPPPPAPGRQRQQPATASRASWLGAVADPQPLYQAADLLVLPSRSEGFANALIEAMGCGLPVVATRVGGNPEIVEDGATGILVAPGDTGALAAAIRGLLAEPERRRRLGARARTRVIERYRLATVEERWAALYASLER